MLKGLKVLCINAGMHGAVLDFAKRLDVATDVAHAVTYLHMYSGKFIREIF